MNKLSLRFISYGVMLFLAACGGTDQDTEVVSTPLELETPDHFLLFLNEQENKSRSAIHTSDFTEAYYNVVDPRAERTTLEGWQAANDFDSCDDEVHIIFRDAKDLGYGRDMYGCKHNDGRFAVFVRNFIVKIFNGDPSNYGPINVEAAIEADLTYHAGTNAIEFTPIDPDDPNSEKVAKFFTFSPDGQQSLRADLDGRGLKDMPQPCLLCHGATLLPWDTDAVNLSATPWDIEEVFQTVSSAKMNQLELDTFDYSSLYDAWSRENQENDLRKFNGWVRDTYAEMAERDQTSPGYWCPDYAIELAVGRYGEEPDPATANLCDSQNDVVLSGDYQDDYVPSGWQPAVGRPEGVEILYKEVIEPNCTACHSLRGNAAGERAGNGNLTRSGNAINFNSYEEFIGYADLIEEYVYQRGVMPLSLRNYLDFWEDPTGAPAILANFLPGFSSGNADGSVSEPGKPLAKPGADRTVVSPATLDASASYYAASYQWQVTNASACGDCNYGFDDDTSSAPLFTADDGDYVIELTVSNNLGSDVKTLKLTVDSSMSPAPADITFEDHIKPILQDAPVAGEKRQECTFCHAAALRDDTGNIYRGIPVVYDDSARLYEDVLARVNFDDPENSSLLRKPTREQHGGGVVLDLDDPLQYATYETIVHWIRNGAPEN